MSKINVMPPYTYAGIEQALVCNSKINMLGQHFVGARFIAGPVDLDIGRARAGIGCEGIAGVLIGLDRVAKRSEGGWVVIEIPIGAVCASLGGWMEVKGYIHLSANRKRSRRL